jgi:hypothetical protein
MRSVPLCFIVANAGTVSNLSSSGTHAAGATVKSCK